MGEYDDWIGRSYTRSEPISDRLLGQYRATLAGTLGPGAVPPGFHWCIGPDVVEPSDLGRDCHSRTGIFLPALPLPRRMWAGGKLEFHRPFNPGDHVARTSTIEDVVFKQGRSGALGFVKQRHDYSVDGTPYLSERQDIVYREDPKPGSTPTVVASEDWPDAESWSITPDTTLLFRYSALTFNGHRIHYDYPYATEVEGYAGLVVHGPLQAIWMMNLATKLFGHLPARFTYRGRSPLICNIPVRVEARAQEGALALRVRRETDHVTTMEATAFAP
ncbi:3-methylfumaryl-CoA hydratase [Roseovarius lutimaris]|uniref:3-methylfumaryl-CoA hydratase n=1 Tax=Roseovarius lutimaris TaxID=1005928 RepID=A0A1I5ARJ8_9RHOB|nr:MaoC family dehydratase N-terminal domain-containing protein [Roseovarius lutimaris]SFN65057.1 3-methylfumaryl-CoA hydratase [Roseovarius lutimaris]